MSQPTALSRSLQGSIVHVTGAGSGMGRATAEIFAAEGAHVAATDFRGETAEATAEAIRAAGGSARAWALDVSDADQVRRITGEIAGHFGGLDILVNNAAMRNYSAAALASAAEWQAIVGVNLVGITHYCHAALPQLRSSGHGSIVNVSSCYAVKGRKGMALYDATKAAQLALTRSLACEEAVHGVRVNAVCPGSTLTDFHVGRALKIGKSVEQLKTERKDTSLLGRWATPEEIAWPILWLASLEGSFITGSTLVVDGGLHIV